MFALRWLLLIGVAGFLVVVLTGEQPTASGQGAKDKTKKGLLLNPDPLEISKTGELSPRTLVTRPPFVKGARSWTIETKRHRWIPINVAVSPDASTLATSGYDGVIHLWDASTGKHLRALVGHTSYVYGIAWSPDGTLLASSGSYDATARIWNPKTGMTLRVLKGHKGYTGWLTWSPDGTTLLVTGGTSGFATFWDVNNNKQLKTLEHGTGVTSVAWSPDGKYVACGTTQTGFLWNADNYTNVTTFKQDGNTVYSVAFSADSKYLLTGGKTDTLVWEVETQKIAHTIMSEGNVVSWSPDGKHVVTAGSGAGKLWDAEGFKHIKPLTFGMRSCCWTKDSKTFYGLNGHSIHSLRVDNDKSTEPFEVAASGSMIWAPGRPVVAGLGTVSPELYNSASGKRLMSLEGHKGGVTTALWSLDNKFLATASADKTVRIWDAAGKLLRTLEGHGGSVSALAWAGDGRIATAGVDKLVRIFDSDSTSAEKTLIGHTHPVTALAWSRDGKMLVSVSADRNISVWNQEMGKPFKVLQTESDLRVVAITPDGRFVATGSTDDVVRVYSLPTLKVEYSLEVRGSPKDCTSLAWSPDGSLLASGRANHTMQIWSAKTQAMVHSVQCMAPVHAVAWSPDGKTFSAASADRAIRFYDLATGRIRATVIQDEKQLITVMPEGNYRVADSESELICVVQTEKTQDTFDAKTFMAKFPWRNNPGAVSWLAK